MKTLSAVALAVFAYGCASTPRISLPPCAAHAGAQCGTIPVPESRSNASDRIVSLNTVVFPAKSTETQADPVVILAGGPGQGATSLIPLAMPELAEVNRTRDIVFIDQRGTGTSNPLNCAAGFQILDKGPAGAIESCVTELNKRATVTEYTTDVAADDLRDALHRLGYKRANLIAASYGTRLALVVAQRYPDLVRTMTLRAVTPPEFNILYHATLNLAGQMERLFRDCNADARCAAAYPDLATAYRSVRNTLDEQAVTIRAMHPLKRVEEHVTITHFLFDQFVYAFMLTAPTRQQLPLLISEAARGNYANVAPMALYMRDALYATLPVGMYLSVVCAEDVPRLTEADKRTMETTLPDFVTNVAAACQSWPRGRVAPELAAPVKINAPVLLVSGELDPATPPAAATAAMRLLPNSRHIVARAAAHGPLFPGCVKEAVAHFIETKQPNVDPECAGDSELPPFAIKK